VREVSEPKKFPGYRILYSSQQKSFKIQKRFLWRWVDLHGGLSFGTRQDAEEYLEELTAYDWKEV
jgi:hypothetical protein